MIFVKRDMIISILNIECKCSRLKRVTFGNANGIVVKVNVNVFKNYVGVF